MAQVIRFFPRQTLIGMNSISVEYYSEVFEVSEAAELDVQLVVFSMLAVSGAATGGITGVIETTADPTLDSWTGIGGQLLVTATGGGITGTISNLTQFVRAKVTVEERNLATLAFEGVAREST